MAGKHKLKSVEVRAISPEKYPQFRKDRDHLFMHMEEGPRKKEAVEIFAHVHAQRSLGERGAKERSKKAG